MRWPLLALLPLLLWSSSVQAQTVMVEVRFLEERIEFCEQLGVGFDGLLDSIEPRLRFISALDESDEAELLGDVQEATDRKAEVDACDRDLQGQVETLEAKIGDGAVGQTGDSATAEEALALIALQERFEAGKRRVDESFGRRQQQQREARLEQAQALAQDLVE